MLSKNPNFIKNLKFIIFRILVMIKLIIFKMILNKKNINKKFYKIELEHIKLNFYFSFKLIKFLTKI